MSVLDILDGVGGMRTHLGEVIDCGSALVVRVHAGPDVTLLQCDALESATREGPLAVGDVVLVVELTTSDERGVVLGRVRPTQPAPSEQSAAEASVSAECFDDARPDSLVLEARSSLILRVGSGSIEIRADGKILIKGTDLVSHAQRMNRIKGGAVAIN